MLLGSTRLGNLRDHQLGWDSSCKFEDRNSDKSRGCAQNGRLLPAGVSEAMLHLQNPSFLTLMLRSLTISASNLN
jgi:hypothetical protein